MSEPDLPTTFLENELGLAAVVILGIVIVLLFGVVAIGFCLFLRKRELLCFKLSRTTRKNYSDTEYSYLYERQEERVRPRRRFLNRESQVKHPDPFTKRFSEIPLDIDLEDDLVHWDNPLFDRKKDAAITIQSWWRMIR